MNSVAVSGKELKGSRNWLAECYIQLLLVNAIILIITLLVPEIERIPGIAIVPAVLSCINCLVLMVRSRAPLANPVSIYMVIWLVLIPLTSFEAPLMEAMSSFEWRMCAGFGVTYCIAGLLLARKTEVTTEKVVTSYEISSSTENVLLGLIGVSIAAMVANFTLGGVALFSEDDLARKTLSSFVGYPLLSSVGSVGIALLANHYRLRRPKLYVILLVAYLMLQALTGARFVAIITLIMTGVMVASHRLGKKHLRMLALGGVCVLLVFSFVSSYRSSAEHMDYYYISSGIYRGEASDLTSTEMVRYFGMNQRNMSAVLEREFSLENTLEHTLSPITSVFASNPEGLGTSTYGYTANNIIAYAYHDAGWGMWALLFVWSLLVNGAFTRFSQNRASLIRAYWWSAMAMSLTMSFFSYLSAYAYWMFLFPVMVWSIHALLSRKAAMGATEPAGRRVIKSRVGC